MRYACHFYLYENVSRLCFWVHSPWFSQKIRQHNRWMIERRIFPFDVCLNSSTFCWFAISPFLFIYVWWHMNSHPFHPRSFGWISFLMRHKTRWFICHSSSVMNELSNKSVWVLFACEVNDSICELHFRRITDWCWWWAGGETKKWWVKKLQIKRSNQILKLTN